MTKLVPVAIELLVLRLKWWQVILCEPSQVMTAVFGYSVAPNESPVFRDDATLSDTANPWAVQFAQGVWRLISTEAGEEVK